MSEVINLNDLDPVAPAGFTNVKWQKGSQPTGIDVNTGLPVYPVSAYYQGAGSGAYHKEIPQGTIDGTNTVYQLTQAPNFVIFYMRNGVIQNPLLPIPDYTISGTTLTVAKPLEPSGTTGPDTHLIVYV